MGFSTKYAYFISVIMFMNLLLLSGCSLDDADIVRAPPNEDIVIKRERERRGQYDPDAEEETLIGGLIDSLPIFGGDNKETNYEGIAVNSYLWRASLDTLSFMPLLSADPFGGVIITDWHSTSETSREKFKIVTYILGKELRVDALKVSVFKRLKNEDGDWVDAKSSSILKNKVEDAILTKARKYKIQTINN